MTVGGNRSYGLAGEEPCWTGAAVGEKLISSGVGLFFSGRSDITKESSFSK